MLRITLHHSHVLPIATASQCEGQKPQTQSQKKLIWAHNEPKGATHFIDKEMEA